MLFDSAHVLGFGFVTIAVAGGPDWADIMTAVGTVAVAVAAVWVALWTDRRSWRQLRDERRVAVEREQRTEAYSVQVVPAYMSADGPADRSGDPDGPVWRLAVMVVNHGYYTITGVEAQFSLDGRGSLIQPQRSEYVSGFAELPKALRGDWAGSPAYAMQDVLTPRGTGIRFESPAVPVSVLANPYPLVRWTDRWGARWEHRRGEVRRVGDDEEWAP